MIDAPLFGTDGIRGAANTDLTAEVALALGRAAVEVLGGDLVIVGADTRISGPMLEGALTAGVCSAGSDVEVLGVVPTPAVAWASADRGAPAAMISASHNPFADNGIKLFAAGGRKLNDTDQDAIEKRYLDLLATGTTAAPVVDPERVGGRRSTSGVSGWVDVVVGSVGTDALSGLRIVLDCANGAAAELGARALPPPRGRRRRHRRSTGRTQHQPGVRLDRYRRPAGRGGAGWGRCRVGLRR